ncbi:PHD-finger family protein [Trichomonas vaginalis G3]|uniref:PHD-finger family protein n=1 Tax=Trichomonas vaginalis (strain ATCC PRA-98 / G3) TaxID=412133 RepID=A2G5R9_TRIV3|nr:PHD zinc finger-containing protein [Trichomonas vaginalis G3]EAX87499.1 PHD-finger family protein [Trichomonas vaginalis G3]KAI5528904.1 PHD zinc finger-containing protein [Trichomonas vaginalis G3]|eukprot:XP_001300429.1 PHD-finger family protein [Trichomonas vaginalis G3]
MSEEKNVSSLIGLLHNNAPPSTPVVKKIAAGPIISRKFTQKPQIPDNYLSIANAFLLTPDMTGPRESPIQNDSPEQVSDKGDVEVVQETRCICGLTHGSSVQIQCDSCQKWLHEDCVHLKNSKEADPFICIYCQYEIAKAVKAYVRQRLASLLPKAQQLEIEMQNGRITQYMPIWNELSDIVADIQEVLKLIPELLRSEDDKNTI